MYPNSPLTYGGAGVANEGTADTRGDNTWHPGNWYLRGNPGMQHETHGPKQLLKENRVLLWDIDQTWSFDPGSFPYNGATIYEGKDDPTDATYVGGFKNILFNDRMRDTHFVFNFFANEDFHDKGSGRIQDLTRWGASDGTSRTNAHAISCWVRHSLPADASLVRN